MISIYIDIVRNTVTTYLFLKLKHWTTIRCHRKEWRGLKRSRTEAADERSNQTVERPRTGAANDSRAHEDLKSWRKERLRAGPSLTPSLTHSKFPYRGISSNHWLCCCKRQFPKLCFTEALFSKFHWFVDQWRTPFIVWPLLVLSNW